MSDLSTTIRINDGFSEPLKNLTKAAIAAQSPMQSLKEAIAEVHEETDYQAVAIESLFYAVDKASSKIEKILRRQFKALKKQTKPLMKLIKKSLPKELKNIEKTIEKTAQSFAKAAKKTDLYKKSMEKVSALQKGFKFKVAEMKFNASNLKANSILHGGYFKYARDVFAEKSPKAARFVKRAYEGVTDNAKIAKSMVKEFGVKDTVKAYKSLIDEKLDGTKVGDAIKKSQSAILDGIKKGQSKFTDMKNLVQGRAAYWKNVADINGVGKTAQAFGYIAKTRAKNAAWRGMERIGEFNADIIWKGMEARDAIKTKGFKNAVLDKGTSIKDSITKTKAYDKVSTGLTKTRDFAVKEFNIVKKFALEKGKLIKTEGLTKLSMLRQEAAFRATSARMSLKIGIDELRWKTAFWRTDLKRAKNVAIEKGKHALNTAKDFLKKQKAIIDKKGLSGYINDLSKGPKGKGVVGAFRRHVFDPRKGIIDRAKDLGKTVQKNASKAAKYVKKTPIKKMVKDFENVAAKGIGKGFKKIANSGPGKFFGGFAKDFGKMFSVQILSSVFSKAADKFKQKLLDAGHALVDAINNSMDELTLSDKFSTMYGEAGKAAQARAYDLANELGESATTVGEMSMRAAKEGFSTDEFEKVMRLSDRISSLSIGETTGDVAQNLFSNLKSNHDAGSLAQMLGGGEMMEKQIRRSGYEQALNRGDVGKALEIAEEIAKQAGFTDEKYAAASDTMSQNFQGIMNTVDNIKKKLGEAYVQGLAPTVKRIKEIMDSPQFKKVIEYVTWGVKKIGEFINKVMMKVVGNTKTLGVLFGVGVALKIWLCAVHLKQTIGLAGFLMKIVRWMGNAGIGQVIKKLIIEKGIRASIAKLAKKAAIGGLVIAWMTIILKILHKIFGKGKSFTDFVKGALFGVVKIILNLFKNGKILFTKIKSFLKRGMIGWKIAFYELIASSKEKILETVAQVVYTISDMLNKSPLSKIFDFNFDTVANNVMLSLEEAMDTEETQKEVAKLRAEFEEINRTGFPEFVGILDGFKESMDTNGQSVIDELKKMSPKVGDLVDKTKGILGDTNKIRKTNEQEEELRWMKAFSDRQISSAYNQTVSQVHNMTVNGAPQTMMAHVRQFYANAHATNYRRLH